MLSAERDAELVEEIEAARHELARAKRDPAVAERLCRYADTLAQLDRAEVKAPSRDRDRLRKRLESRLAESDAEGVAEYRKAFGPCSDQRQAEVRACMPELAAIESVE